MNKKKRQNFHVTENIKISFKFILLMLLLLLLKMIIIQLQQQKQGRNKIEDFISNTYCRWLILKRRKASKQKNHRDVGRNEESKEQCYETNQNFAKKPMREYCVEMVNEVLSKMKCKEK